MNKEDIEKSEEYKSQYDEAFGYEKQNKTHRITFRLSDTDYFFVMNLCEILDTTPSKILRSLINNRQEKEKGGDKKCQA